MNKTVRNPAIGHRITFLQTAVQTNGELLQIMYAMGWAVWPFDDAVQSGADAPIALSHGGDSLGFNHVMLLVPEQDMGLVLLLNTKDPTIASAFSNIAFDVALLALGQETQNYPLEENWVNQHLRPLSAALILLLLTAAWFALQRLRQKTFSRRDGWLFIGLAAIDLTLTGYSSFVRLPNNNLNVRQVIQYQPDLGILLILILLLTTGWGSARSHWALYRWRVGLEQQLSNR